ncbi:molybdopterin-synthase adenylyltransferase MoeB [Methylophilaceae bacterium]|jgi:molybdopterin/thiamine biosynthesis adenylyltransferase|nr:molybdopterin-synthase adenylyltransferase MoeB [Methylophilaceae bacterium]
MTDNQLIRYSRHILLPDIEYEGQLNLINSHILIVGAGGLGSAASIYLAASGIGKITICDFDTVDLSNLQRQILHTDRRLGINKALSAKSTLEAINPEVKIFGIEERLDAEKMKKLAYEVDVIIDCSDNFLTRYSLNQIAYDLKKPLVSGAAIGFDGQVSVFDFRDENTPCYQCLFPDTSEDEELRCSDHGVFSPIVGIIGCTQAAEAMKIILKVGKSLMGRLLILESKGMNWKNFKVPKDPQCKVCSNK